MNKYYVFSILLFGIISTNTAMQRAIQARRPSQVNIVRPFFSNTKTIATIKAVMDEIENRRLGYEDYSKRTGLVWSDVLVKTGRKADIIKEFQTTKVTQVRETLMTQFPQSILNYPVLQSIVSDEILPKMFETVRAWTKLPEEVYAQIFFQRCCSSEAMDWHQDPGEDYDPQANYSLVLMLSEQDDPEHGWHGGKFKIRSGLPEDKYDEADVQEIIPQYNQGIIFNNQLNSHAAMQVIPKLEKAKRDIIVIPINLTKLPTKKE